MSTTLHKSTAALDAEFLESVVADPTATATTATGTSSSSSVSELHRSNLLRLQSDELIQECSLSMQNRETSWAKHVQEYVHTVSQIIENMPTSKVSWESFWSSKKKKGNRLPPPPPFLSEITKTNSKNSLNDFDIPKLRVVEPMGCYVANLGLTKPSGNASVLPTVDLKVHLPNAMFDAKDYLRHRYFHVSRIHLIISIIFFYRKLQMWTHRYFFQLERNETP